MSDSDYRIVNTYFGFNFLNHQLARLLLHGTLVIAKFVSQIVIGKLAVAVDGIFIDLS